MSSSTNTLVSSGSASIPASSVQTSSASISSVHAFKTPWTFLKNSKQWAKSIWDDHETVGGNNQNTNAAAKLITNSQNLSLCTNNLHSPSPQWLQKNYVTQGNQWRSQLIFLVTHSLNRAVSPIHKDFAQVIELIHSASLAHDDVMDDGEKRREMKTLNKIWGNRQAILAGDYLLAKALIILHEIPCNDLIHAVLTTLHTLILGQMADIDTCHGPAPLLRTYINVIRHKTAALFALCCQGAAMISNGTPDQIHRLEQFGFSLGMAYQIADDAKEYFMPVTQWDGGHDYCQKKWTYPTLLAHKAGIFHGFSPAQHSSGGSAQDFHNAPIGVISSRLTPFAHASLKRAQRWLAQGHHTLNAGLVGGCPESLEALKQLTHIMVAIKIDP